MTVQIDLRMEGFSKAVRAIDDARGRVSDFSNAFHEIDGVVSDMFRRRFDSEGRSPDNGAAWTPLAPATIAHRLSRPGGNRGGVLWDFGNLRAALVKVGPDSIRVIDPMRYERGTSRPGAYAHQEGRGLPKREIIPDPMPDKLMKEFEDILVAHVVAN